MILLFERSLGLSRCECVWQGLNPGLAVFFHILSPLVTSVMQCFPQNYVAFGAVPKAGATHRHFLIHYKYYHINRHSNLYLPS